MSSLEPPRFNFYKVQGAGQTFEITQMTSIEVLALCYFWDLEKIALAKFLFYVRSNKINSLLNRISQILVIVFKNRINEIRSNEIRIRQEHPVCPKCF